MFFLIRGYTLRELLPTLTYKLHCYPVVVIAFFKYNQRFDEMYTYEHDIHTLKYLYFYTYQISSLITTNRCLNSKYFYVIALLSWDCSVFLEFTGNSPFILRFLWNTFIVIYQIQPFHYSLWHCGVISISKPPVYNKPVFKSVKSEHFVFIINSRVFISCGIL